VKVVCYVERNALLANLVACAEAWPWSSLRRVEREDPLFPILSEWLLTRPADWLEIVNRPQSEGELVRLCVDVSSVARLLGAPTGPQRPPSN
jgi:hypothetical protein